VAAASGHPPPTLTLSCLPRLAERLDECDFDEKGLALNALPITIAVDPDAVSLKALFLTI
jgi:hypothetical protein